MSSGSEKSPPSAMDSSRTSSNDDYFTPPLLSSSLCEWLMQLAHSRSKTKSTELAAGESAAIVEQPAIESAHRDDSDNSQHPIPGSSNVSFKNPIIKLLQQQSLSEGTSSDDSDDPGTVLDGKIIPYLCSSFFLNVLISR